MNLRNPGRYGTGSGIAIICSVCGFATQAQTVYTDAPDHYSFALEAGWVEIPKAVMDEYAGVVADKTNGIRVEYSTGFQLADRPYVDYPYILIQEYPVDENSSIYSEIEQVFTRDNVSGRVQDVTSEVPELMRNATVDDPYIDKERNIVMVRMSSDVANVGTVNSLTAMFLGAYQITQLNFHWESGDHDDWEPVFYKTIDSFRFDDGYGYQATASGSTPKSSEPGSPSSRQPQ